MTATVHWCIPDFLPLHRSLINTVVMEWFYLYIDRCLTDRCVSVCPSAAMAEKAPR